MPDLLPDILPYNSKKHVNKEIFWLKTVYNL
jgi:hypothetical protein